MTQTTFNSAAGGSVRVVVSIAVLAAAALAGEPELLRLHLPFRAGATFLCEQGNHGAISHSDGVNDHAYDFSLPDGTDVLSAAAGRVILAIDVYTEAGLDPVLKKRCNLVWIDHGGGRLTIYEHLQPRSLRVAPGQLVNAGQVLALSGNTGYSSGPHLHFGVTDLNRMTVPSRFLEVREGNGVPVTGGSYTSANDGIGASWFAADSTVPTDWFAGDGVVLSSEFPALCWNWDRAMTLRGSVAGDAAPANLFVSPLGEYGAIAVKWLKPGPDRNFDVSLRAAEFEGPINKTGACWFGIAKVVDGKFHCSRMVPLVLWRDGVDDSGRPIVPLRLPFRTTEAHAYERDPWEGSEPRGVLLAIRSPSNTSIRAAGSGRVVVSDSKRPVSLDRGGKAVVTTLVTIDHGGGVTTEYVGMEKIAVHEGEIVAGGTELGASAKSPWGKDPHFLFRARGRMGGPQPRFAELGDLTALAKRGTATAASLDGGPAVFRADSTADADMFRGLGITALAGAPAHTFHAGTKYALRGDAPETVAEVTFLVRERGAARTVRVASCKPRNGKFELDVGLEAFAKSLGDGPWEWALGVPNAARGVDGGWSPLVIVR